MIQDSGSWKPPISLICRPTMISRTSPVLWRNCQNPCQHVCILLMKLNSSRNPPFIFLIWRVAYTVNVWLCKYSNWPLDRDTTPKISTKIPTSVLKNTRYTINSLQVATARSACISPPKYRPDTKYVISSSVHVCPYHVKTVTTSAHSLVCLL